MQVIYAHEHPETTPARSIFLAGPSPRGNGEYDWRPEALETLAELGFDGAVYVPLPRDGVYLVNYDDQVDWELQYLEAATVITFWIPRNIQSLPGFTTNVEFGLFVRSGKAVLGYPVGAPKMKYLHRVAERYSVPVFNTLGETLKASVEHALV